jgi:hypothetical protein
LAARERAGLAATIDGVLPVQASPLDPPCSVKILRLDVDAAERSSQPSAVFYSTPTGGIQQRNVLVEGAVNVLASGDFNRGRC